MAPIPQEKIDEIRSSVNLVHYIGQFVNLKQAGKDYKGLCPFHQEKTPSFVVSPKKQIYHCFGCGRGGNLFSFIIEYEKLPFVEAVQKAADFAGIVLPKSAQQSEEISHSQKLYQVNEKACRFFEEQLQQPQHKQYKNYFEKRDISDKTIAAFRLGYAPDSYDKLINQLNKAGSEIKLAEELGLIQQRQSGSGYYDKFRQRIIFPFFSLSGKIVGFGGRKMREEQQPKYLNSPENAIYNKGSILYGLHQAIQAIRDKQYIILVEGYFDLLRLYENGIRNVVASSGTALSDNQARLMARYTRSVYIAYDGDEAGIKAALRNAQIIENQDLHCFVVPMPEGDDPDSYVQENGPGRFRKLLEKKVLPIEFRVDRFRSTQPDAGMEEKELFIGEVLDELARFSNSGKAGLYLHHLADEMEVNEKLLVDELNRRRREVVRQERKRASFKKRQQQEKEPSSAEQAENKPLIQSLRGVHKAEEGIIEMLLNAEGAVRAYIMNNVGFEMFENEVYADLYTFIIHELEEHGDVELHRIYENPDLTPELQNVLTRLSVRDFEKEMRFANDCIFQLKKWHLQKEARELMRHIKAESESEEAVLHYTTELNRVNRAINALEKEHRNHRHNKTH